MCLILLAVAASDEYPLIIAANRDEFFERPTQSADFWPGTGLLAGKDLRQGGSWFGVSRQGRLAMVTNVRTPAVETSSLSRGHLVRDFLLSGTSAASFIAGVVEPPERYPGFNLILGSLESLYFASNRSTGCGGVIPSGIHGLSNASLDTPWPKVERGRTELKKLLDSGRQDVIGGLFALLQDRTLASDAELPETGVSLEWERVLSARFIHSRDYGTRASTLLLVDRQRQARFIEQSYTADGSCGDERRFTLQF